MKARVLVLAVVAAMAAVYLFHSVGGSGDSERIEVWPRETRPAAALAQPLAAPSAPLRNVFLYSEAAPSAAMPRAVAPRVAPGSPEPAPSAAPAVRLVGLLRRAGQLQAALVILGETVVLTTGESAAGYTVLAIDEDEGVRLRGPDGSTVVLAPPSE